MEYELDRGIAVGRTAPGEYAADLGAGWVVGGGLNGGYLLAVIGNAIRSELTSGQPDPVSVSAYYLSPSVPGPAVVRVRVVRTGGRRSTVAASLFQHQGGTEVERITALAVFGHHVELTSAQVQREIPPAKLPPLEVCVPTTRAPADFIEIAPLLQRFGTRLDPESVGWAVGEPSGNGVIQGWFRLADDRPLDPIALLVAVDALPPVTFDLGLPGWAPTLELTVHVRARPSSGPAARWAIVRHATRNISGGHFEEDCEVWDSHGHLVAQSRQLALLPLPPVERSRRVAPK